jgi:hypothetical protein
MKRKPNRSRADPPGNAIKDPKDWKTGDEPMTAAQESYLGTLASEAGEEPETDLTKAEASERIDELQEKTGRGQGATDSSQ